MKQLAVSYRGLRFTLSAAQTLRFLQEFLSFMADKETFTLVLELQPADPQEDEGNEWRH